MPINTQKTFYELVDSYHKEPNKFVFFVGAGLSRPLFPSWAKLLKDFVACAKESTLPYDEKELLQYIENGEDYLDIAESCVSAMGESRYRDLMEETFDRDFSLDEVPDGYKALMDLSPKTIITTNYDRIPDVAGKGLYRIGTNKNVPETARSFANGKNIVFKMHGDITDHSSIVLTTSDYQRIIHENTSTRSLLTSLLSTKTLIFAGFSLSDPHVDVILQKIKSINNDLPISHYVLLDEDSAFKISSFERKYGVKIISYSPSDGSHPEVIEFLRALNCEDSEIPEQHETPHKKHVIKDVQSLITYLNEATSDTIVDTGVSIFYEDSDIYLSFSPTGETKGEIQKEILSIIRLMNFECELVTDLIISIYSKTPPRVNVDESQPLLLKIKIKFLYARNFAEKQISTSTVWKLIEFYAPISVTNSFQKEERISFPMSTGIVG